MKNDWYLLLTEDVFKNYTKGAGFNLGLFI